MPTTVAHSFPVWLPQTQTWLFNQVRFLPESIISHIICKETEHLDQFYLPNIHTLAGSSSRTSAITTRLFRHLDYHYYTRRTCRRIRPDILHSHFGPVGWKNYRMLQMPPVGNLKDIKQVVTFYGRDVDQLPCEHPDWYRRYRDMFEHIDLVLCEGSFMARKVEELGCPPERLRIHHLGVDLQTIAFRPRKKRKNEPFKILMAAAFRPKKGFLYGLQALERLASRYELEVTLVGDTLGDAESDREKERIEAFTGNSQLAGNVTLTGFLTGDQLHKTALEHYIYLAPSITTEDGDSEGGVPVSLIEMAAGGMPVVSSRHCDIPEVIRHGESGLLSNERDVDGLTAHLETLFHHPDSWIDFARKARAHIEEHYDAVKQGEHLSNIYEEVERNSLHHNNLSYNYISDSIERPEEREKTHTRPGQQEKTCTRIVFISHSGEMYGAERSLFTLLTGLKKLDCYEILVLLPVRGTFSQALHHAGISTRVVPVTRWIGNRFHQIGRYYRRVCNWWYIPEIARELSPRRPDLIYTNTLATPLGALLKERLPGNPPHIWHARELPEHPDFGYFDWGSKAAFRLITRNSDRFICNSRYLSEQIRPFLNRGSSGPEDFPVDVIYNGFELSEDKQPDEKVKSAGRHVNRTESGSPADEYKSRKMDTDLPHDGFQIIMVGSITPLKNNSDAIDALRILIGEGLPLTLDIYGEGPPSYIKKLKKKIRAAGLQRHVTLMGFYNDTEQLYAEANLLLITSKIETFGRVAVEAMLAGCPVISSDAGGLPEVIEHGETGLLYRTGDIEALAGHIRYLYSDFSIRAQMAQKARACARSSYSADRYVKAVHELIQESLPSNKQVIRKKESQ